MYRFLGLEEVWEVASGRPYVAIPGFGGGLGGVPCDEGDATRPKLEGDLGRATRGMLTTHTWGLPRDPRDVAKSHLGPPAQPAGC